jgi:hypothetical protein
MKSPRATLVATAIPLLLTSLSVSAAEPPYNAPSTERAKESALLLHQTAHALYDSSPGASSGQHISNLWLFPTADADTVFARYDLTSGEKTTSGATASRTQHLTVLTVRGNRILESRELTSARVESASNEPPKLHWSAAIGSGNAAKAMVNADATNPNATSSSHTTSASPDWTARIGTGTAAASAASVGNTAAASSSGIQPIFAAAHWTAKIGTGHAIDN